MTHSRRLLFFCGQLGVMLLARYFFQWLTYFAARTEVAPDGAKLALFGAAFGGVFIAFRVYDAVTDPVAGVLSDRWVAAGRERRTLLWFSALIPSIGMALMFAPTFDMPPTTRWALMVGGMAVFFTGYTFYGVPYWSLVDDYGGADIEERRTLSNLLGVGMIVATAIGFVVSPAVVQAYGYFHGTLIFGVPAAILMVLPYFAAPPDGAGAADGPTPETAAAEPEADPPIGLDALRATLRHRRYMAVLMLFGGSQMSLTVMTAAAPFLAVELLGGSEQDVAKLLGPLLGLSLPAFFFVPAYSRWLGWERALTFACLALGAVYATTAMLGIGLFGLEPMETAMLLFALGGPLIAPLLGLEGEAVTDCAREGGGLSVSVYFGVYNLVVKALNGFGLAIAFWLGSAALGASDPATRQAWVRWMGPTAGLCLALGVLGYYLLKPREAPTPGSPPAPAPTA